MNLYRRLWIILSMACILSFLIGNVLLSQNNQGHLEGVEVNRLMNQIEQGIAYSELDLKDMRMINVVEYQEISEATQGFLQGKDIKDSNFIIQARYVEGEIQGFYRFLYPLENSDELFVLNSCILLMFISCGSLLYYLKLTLWKPFEELNKAAIALSKGNFTVQLQEQKYHGFGKFVWAMNVLRDELRSSKKRELELEKEKKTMIASISHDMRTPIANIALYAQAFEKQLYSDEAQKRRCIQRIEQNTKKLEAYVQSIIDTSTQNLIDVHVDCEAVYVHDLMRRIKEDIEEKLHLLHIQFVCDCELDGLITIDMEKSLEVLDNLVDNAIKYGDGKRVNLYVRKQNYDVFLVLSNSGVPLEMGEREFIFQSFYRGSNAMQKQGSGLGLYITKAIMEAMDGDIWLESSVEETCFVLRFPCA